MNRPKIQATNAFYYYADLERAWAFYRDVLGFETVLDYGFAKMMRLASTSFLTLVDVKYGMHSLDEPQSIAFALVTQQVEAWHDYLKEVNVPFHRPLNKKAGAAHDGFIVLDPEGYYIEVERFNPHSENNDLLPMLEKLPSIYPHGGSRPAHLGVEAAVFWTYYRDLDKMTHFYESLFAMPLLVDQGWAKIYHIAGSGFLGLVDGTKGMHQAADQKRVTLSFITSDVQQWFDRAVAFPNFELRAPELSQEGEQVDIFVGYDPEGYFLEWDQFRPTVENGRLLSLLGD